MQTPLPVASYLFILRKHRGLVLGVVLLALGVGYFYGKTRPLVFRSVARVQIQSRKTVAAGSKAAVVRDDPGFLSDQIYRLREDENLAAGVLDHLETAPREVAPDSKSTAPVPPPYPPKEAFQALTPKSLIGMVSVRTIPPTSYYEVAIEGGNPDINYAVANAYAEVFARVFREERARQYEGTEKEYRAERDRLGARLEAVNDEMADFEASHPGVNFEKGGLNLDRANADLLKGQLQAESARLIPLERGLESVQKALSSVGLRFEEKGEEGAVLLPVLDPDAPPEDEPRLSPRIQSLEAVRGNEAVRGVESRIADLLAEDKRLATGVGGTGALQQDAPERQVLRAQVEEERRELARATDAALVTYAEKVEQTRRVVDDLKKTVEPLENKAAAISAALAEHGNFIRKAEDIRAAIASQDELLLEAERQRQRSESDDDGFVRVYQYAPKGPGVLVAPNRPVIYLMTAIAAILLAAALAYVLEFLDDTVKSREDFDRLVRLPFLGFVPHIKEGELAHRDLVVAHGRTGSPEVESFRAIRTGIQFSRADREVRTLLVTSAGPGEGKTTVSVNLAAAFAGGKGRILLVDADLRRARVHSALGVENRRGLTNVLVGDATLEEAVQKSAVEGLDVLASGPIPPNPADVLGSEAMREVLQKASGLYERVVVDSPPLVAVTDPALLAKYVDGVFLVVSVGKTSIRTLLRAKETLATVGAAIHGAVLNNADEKTSGYAGAYGGYGYGYGYASAPEKP